MEDALIINRVQNTKSCDRLNFIFNIVTLIFISIFSYMGYSKMIKTMEFMLKNTYAMCNITQAMSTVDLKCYEL
ncbi:MAG: hypothetical protein CMF41_03015 [Legionellales bacterium]|nr:hypothetical protein [Legionellales bacterium]OUX65370.1 MAG: hypothetical protein CBE41_01660 [Gammaproteobacteria bacterium TMED281]